MVYIFKETIQSINNLFLNILCAITGVLVFSLTLIVMIPYSFFMIILTELFYKRKN